MKYFTAKILKNNNYVNITISANSELEAINIAKQYCTNNNIININQYYLDSVQEIKGEKHES